MWTNDLLVCFISVLLLNYEKLLQGGMRVYVCVRDTSPPGLHVLLSF